MKQVTVAVDTPLEKAATLYTERNPSVSRKAAYRALLMWGADAWVKAGMPGPPSPAVPDSTNGHPSPAGYAHDCAPVQAQDADGFDMDPVDDL